MPDSPSEVVVLAEDQEQRNLVWRYLKTCPRYKARMRVVRLVALPGSRGCGSQYVREQLPRQVDACRGRHANTVLIVITDADNLTVPERVRTLSVALERSQQRQVAAEEPIVVLIPKWQVETWIKCLLGQSVTEDDSRTDLPPVTAEQIRAAARTLYDWARPNAMIGPTCVASLRSALPNWLRVG